MQAYRGIKVQEGTDITRIMETRDTETRVKYDLDGYTIQGIFDDISVLNRAECPIDSTGSANVTLVSVSAHDHDTSSGSSLEHACAARVYIRMCVTRAM